MILGNGARFYCYCYCYIKWVSEDNQLTSSKDVHVFRRSCQPTSCKFRSCPFSEIHMYTKWMPASCLELWTNLHPSTQIKAKYRYVALMCKNPTSYGLSWEEMANYHEKQKALLTLLHECIQEIWKWLAILEPHTGPREPCWGASLLVTDIYFLCWFLFTVCATQENIKNAGFKQVYTLKQKIMMIWDLILPFIVLIAGSLLALGQNQIFALCHPPTCCKYS